MGARSIGAVGFEPTTSCSQSRRATKLRHAPHMEKAGEGVRTLDPDLGKVVLYQLSYSRVNEKSLSQLDFLVN